MAFGDDPIKDIEAWGLNFGPPREHTRWAQGDYVSVIASWRFEGKTLRIEERRQKDATIFGTEMYSVGDYCWLGSGSTLDEALRLLAEDIQDSCDSMSRTLRWVHSSRGAPCPVPGKIGDKNVR